MRTRRRPVLSILLPSLALLALLIACGTARLAPAPPARPTPQPEAPAPWLEEPPTDESETAAARTPMTGGDLIRSGRSKRAG